MNRYTKIALGVALGVGVAASGAVVLGGDKSADAPGSHGRQHASATWTPENAGFDPGVKPTVSGAAVVPESAGFDPGAQPIATPSGLIQSLSRLKQDMADEFTAFCQRAGVEHEQRVQVAQIIGEHQKHLASFAGHPRADLLLERLDGFTRTRLMNILDGPQIAELDRTYLPGAR